MTSRARVYHALMRIGVFTVPRRTTVLDDQIHLAVRPAATCSRWGLKASIGHLYTEAAEQIIPDDETASAHYNI